MLQGSCRGWKSSSIIVGVIHICEVPLPLSTCVQFSIKSNSLSLSLLCVCLSLSKLTTTLQRVSAEEDFAEFTWNHCYKCFLLSLLVCLVVGLKNRIVKGYHQGLGESDNWWLLRWVRILTKRTVSMTTEQQNRNPTLTLNACERSADQSMCPLDGSSISW